VKLGSVLAYVCLNNIFTHFSPTHH